MLDDDGRDYLKLLISGGGKGLDGRGADLREALRRLGPTVRDSARVTRASARRKRELRSLVRHYGLLARELGRSDREIVRLVRGSNAVFGAIAPEEEALSRSVGAAAGHAAQRGDHAGEGGRAGAAPAPRAGGAAALDPPARARPARRCCRWRARPRRSCATASARSRAWRRTEVEELGVGARQIARAAPDLQKALVPLNRLLNMLAYNPGGAEGADRRPRPRPRAPGEPPLLARLERPERHHRVRHLRRPGRVPPLHARQHELHGVQRDRDPDHDHRRPGRRPALRGAQP